MQSERRLLEDRIVRLLKLVPDLPDDELRAELTKHLCVLTAGFLEVTCREILSKYASKRCSPEISRFVRSILSDFHNPKVGKIQELLSEFDATKADHWISNLSDEEADAVDSIVNNRHQIAHGRSVGLSFTVFARYHFHAAKAVAAIENEFPPY
jgi:hypothetical protein